VLEMSKTGRTFLVEPAAKRCTSPEVRSAETNGTSVLCRVGRGGSEESLTRIGRVVAAWTSGDTFYLRFREGTKNQ